MFRLLLALATLALSAREPMKITGENHKLVLFNDGSIGGWGDMRDGQLGPRGAIPATSGHPIAFVPIDIPEKAIDVAACNRASYVLLESGIVLAFGYGADGQLGLGEPGLRGAEVPTPIPGLSNVAKIEAYGATAFAIHRDGSVSAWGSRDSGKIGDGQHSRRYLESGPKALSPVQVPGVANIVQLSASASHVLALTATGRVLSWGNGKLRLGRATVDESGVALPGEIPGLDNVSAVIAAVLVSAVLKKDGSVWIWGSNQQAQFGNGKRDDADTTITPIRVPGITGAVSLTAGSRHFQALMKDGSLRAWGNSDWGQVGNGVSGWEQPTVAVPKITAVKRVFAAGNNSYALRTDGSTWIWGPGSPYKREWPIGPDAKFPIPFTFPQP